MPIIIAGLAGIAVGAFAGLAVRPVLDRVIVIGGAGVLAYWYIRSR